MQYQRIQQLTLENDNFRKVVFTNKYSQVVLMSLLPGEEIGLETHDDVDQVLVFVSGTGEALVDNERHPIQPGDLFNVPAGKQHNFINTGSESLKLFTIYSPPEHPANVVFATKAEATVAHSHSVH